MHDRPPSSPARKRELRNARKTHRKQRAAAGLACCNAEYDGEMLQLLIDHDWLDEADAADRVKVGLALTAMWREATYGK
jgi:hypothetical protein